MNPYDECIHYLGGVEHLTLKSDYSEFSRGMPKLTGKSFHHLISVHTLIIDTPHKIPHIVFIYLKNIRTLEINKIKIGKHLNKIKELTLDDLALDNDRHLFKHISDIQKLEVTNIYTLGRSVIANIVALNTQTLASSKDVFCSNVEYLKNIHTLIIHTGNRLTDDCLKYIKTVHTLILPWNTNITDKGLECLENIKILDLSHNKNISDVGILHIQNINTLYTNSKRITDGGLALFNDIRNLTFVWNEKITMNGLKILHKVQCVIIKFESMLKMYGSETNFKLISTDEDCKECTKIGCKCYDFKNRHKNYPYISSSLNSVPVEPISSHHVETLPTSRTVVSRLQKLLNIH
jgi:hypothetical protein